MSDKTTVIKGDAPDDYVRLSDHPRASTAIARAKAMGGLAGFVLGFLLAQRGGLPAFETGVRALVGGIAGYVLVWVAAIQMWRQLAIGEFKAAERRRNAARLVNRRHREDMAEARKQAAEDARLKRAARH